MTLLFVALSFIQSCPSLTHFHRIRPLGVYIAPVYHYTQPAQQLQSLIFRAKMRGAKSPPRADAPPAPGAAHGGAQGGAAGGGAAERLRLQRVGRRELTAATLRRLRRAIQRSAFVAVDTELGGLSCLDQCVPALLCRSVRVWLWLWL